MTLTEAKKYNIETKNESNFYRGNEREVWESLLEQWEREWISSFRAEKQALSM